MSASRLLIVGVLIALVVIAGAIWLANLTPKIEFAPPSTPLVAATATMPAAPTTAPTIVHPATTIPAPTVTVPPILLASPTSTVALLRTLPTLAYITDAAATATATISPSDALMATLEAAPTTAGEQGAPLATDSPASVMATLEAASAAAKALAATLAAAATTAAAPDVTATAAATLTATPGVTATAAETLTATPTATPSLTATPTAVPSDTATPSETPTATATAAPSDTATPSETPTATATAAPSDTATPSETLTATTTPSETPTATSTVPATPSETPTETLTATPAMTATAVATLPVTPAVTATVTETLTATPSATVAITATLAATPGATPAAPDVVIQFSYESASLPVHRIATYYADGRVILEDRRREAQWEVMGKPEDVARLVARLEQQGFFALDASRFGEPCARCLTYRLTARQGTQTRTIQVDTPPWVMATQLPRALGALRSTIALLQIATDSTMAANPPGRLQSTTPTPPAFSFGSPKTVGDLEVAMAAPLSVTALGGAPALQPEAGRFLIVLLRIRNLSRSAQQITAATTFVEGLVDDRGQHYDVHRGATARYAEAHGLRTFSFYRIAPGETVEGVLAFDVPPQASGLRLVVRDADPLSSNPPAILLPLPDVAR